VTPRGHLFRKYVIIIAGLVSGALLASGAIEIYFSYYENREALVALQREKAIGVAARIDAYIKEIEQQISWTTQPQLGAAAAATYQRRVDNLRLLRQEDFGDVERTLMDVELDEACPPLELAKIGQKVAQAEGCVAVFRVERR